jgi:hypothetical protein
VTLLNYTLEFALQISRAQKRLSGLRGHVKVYLLRRLVRCLGSASTGLPSISRLQFTVRDYRQPSAGTAAYQVAELRGSPIS